jgi:hypothetical protein
MILDSEGLSQVDIRVKPGVYATYHGKGVIQYGSESIEAKLDANREVSFQSYIYEDGKLRIYRREFFRQLTAKERIGRTYKMSDGRTITPKSMIYTLVIGKHDSLLLFNETIGFSIKRKAEKLGVELSA